MLTPTQLSPQYQSYLSHTAQKTMDLKTPNNGEYSNSISDLPNPENGETLYSHEPQYFSEDIDSNCSTPYVSAPSSPGRGHSVGFFYSAPASPMHFVATFSSSKSAVTSPSRDASVSGSFEFEFSARFASNGPSAAAGSMSSADELFLNGQIRPMKLSTHLQRPQNLAPLLDLDTEEEEFDGNNDRGRDLRLRNKSLRRRTRSLSPLRNVPFPWRDNEEDNREDKKSEIGLDLEDDESSNKIEMASTETPSVSASSSRSSSAGRNSKRWVFLKDFLYRSKSEGRSSSGKFWSTISFSPAKDKKPTTAAAAAPTTTTKSSIDSVQPTNSPDGSSTEPQKHKRKVQMPSKKSGGGKTFSNGIGKRRIPASPHELHYTANRAQAEEMRKKTFLPYRQGLLGCLGFSSKGYGAMNGFARALNPVSSR